MPADEGCGLNGARAEGPGTAGKVPALHSGGWICAGDLVVFRLIHGPSACRGDFFQV